ncbi:MAG: recombinase family protein [[Ruminococcus] torques]
MAKRLTTVTAASCLTAPAFQEMMRMIEQGEANCVIVKDLSRLGREYIETGRYMRRVFPAYGVRFIAINDNVDTENDAADDLTVSVKNIMNEAYCRDISVKTGAPWKPNGAAAISLAPSRYMVISRPARSIKAWKLIPMLRMWSGTYSENDWTGTVPFISQTN